MRGQNSLLEKYGLKPHDEEAVATKIERLDSSDLESFRKRLTGIEGKFSESYLKQIFGLLPEKLRPQKRKKFKAYDGARDDATPTCARALQIPRSPARTRG
jgi:CRISPR/Cas system-associated endonuclease Cas1